MTAALLAALIPAVAGNAIGSGQNDPGPVYHAGTTRKILQVTGDWDAPAGVPALSRTESRAGVIGTDLGSSFEHKGRWCFLFGDTKGRPGDVMDCMAFICYTLSTWNPYQTILVESEIGQAF